MTESDIAPTSPRSLARRQASLAALAAFGASLIVGLTVVNVASRDVRDQVERRFIALANERERQVEALVAQEYRSASLIASDARWPALVEALRNGNDPEAVAEARSILRSSASVPPGYEWLDLVSGDRVLISTDANAVEPAEGVGEAAFAGRPLMTPPFIESDGIFALVTAPIAVDPPAVLSAKVNARPMMAVLRDTTPLGLGGQLNILRVDGSRMQELLASADEGVSDERGLAEVETSIGRYLYYWQPLRFNPGEVDQWRFVAGLPVSEAYAPLTRLRLWMLGVGGPLTLLLTVAAYLAARRLNRRLAELTNRARLIAQTGRTEFGDGESPIGPDDELTALAGAFDAMGRRVGADLQAARDDAEREREARAHLLAELALAREVQSRLYPDGPLRVAGYELAGLSEPAEQLCGDYFDYFTCLEDGSVVFALGDVSGHGVGPSLMMVEVRSVLRGLRKRLQPLADFVSRLNDQLTEESPSDRFVSLVVGRLQPDTGEVEYVGAGHRAMLVRRGGEVETLASTGMILGIVGGVPFEVARTVIEPGDLLCVVSDGLEETESPDGVAFGWECVGQRFAAHAAQPPTELIAATLADCVEHSGSAEPADDRTLLAVKRSE